MHTTDLIEVNFDIALVRKSLKRSELRMRVLKMLGKGSSYLSELAREVRSDPSNVQGALEGLGVRYKPELSLVGLNLVERSRDIYRITEFGRIILNLYNKEKNAEYTI